MVHNINHDKWANRVDIKLHIHGFEYAKFGADPSMKLALQAMVMGVDVSVEES